MTIWDALWLALGITACVIEGIALFNSVPGDTLSEHIWAWTGVRTQKWHDAGTGSGNVSIEPVTPKWTVRVARLLVIVFLGWLTIHLTTGWM